MSRDRRLIDKGADAPFQGLVDQTNYHIGLARKHVARLTENNWVEGQTEELVLLLATLDTEQARKLDERSGARQATRDEAAAVSEAKSLVNRMRNLVKQVVRKNPGAGVTVADFNAGGPLNRTASRISKYLGDVRPHALKLDAAFAPFFKNQPLTTLIDQAKKKLDGASATQAVDYASLPDDTAAVLELKGKILEAIEDLNAVGRNTFEGEAELRAMFNKDILTKARKTRPKKDDGNDD